MASKWVSNAAETFHKIPMTCIWIFVQQSHDPSPHRTAAGQFDRPSPGRGHGPAASPPWQMACEQVIDGPFAEDGTDFSSYATGAPARLPLCDCCRVVVAGHADHARARAHRSQ